MKKPAPSSDFCDSPHTPAVGDTVGSGVGEFVGTEVGDSDGAGVGTGVGAAVGTNRRVGAI